MPDRISALSRVAFWIAAAVAFGFAVDPHPVSFPSQLSDKILHMVAFATLGALGIVGYPGRAMRLLAGLTMFGLVIELVQAIPILNRDSDIVDWIADIVAASVAIAATRLIHQIVLRRINGPS